MTTKKYHITNCIWHLGDYEPEEMISQNLPKDFFFEIEVDPDFLEDAIDILSDEISEYYGWLHEGF